MRPYLLCLFLMGCTATVTPPVVEASVDQIADAAAEAIDESAPGDAGSCCVWWPQTWYPGDGPILVCKPRASVLVTCPDSGMP